MSMETHSSIPPHERAFTFHSATVGDAFSIRVALPGSYDMTDASYPVLYVLDADRSFGLASSTLAYINLGGAFGMDRNIPEMIVVGIGYDRGLLRWLTTRVRDLTPTEDSSFNYGNPEFSIPESGRADAFLAFVQNELQPTLKSSYRIASSGNLLATHSLAGVLALYSMLRSRPVFDKYLLCSPFVGWDDKVIFRVEENCAARNRTLPAEMFMAVSGEEPTPSYRDEILEFRDTLRGHDYEGFRLGFADYGQDNHFSVWSKAFIDGLVYLFAEE